MGGPGPRPAPAASGPGGRRRRRRKAPGAAFFSPLLVLLLLSPPRGCGAWKGETCRRWAAGETVPAAVFLCPEDGEAANALICCGTCARSYCCAAWEERLDQRPCFREDRRGGPTPTFPAESSSAMADFMYIGLPLILSITLALVIIALAHYETIKHSVRSCRRRQHLPPVMPTSVFSLGDPSRQTPLDLSSPYCSRQMLVPPSGEENPQSDWEAPPPYPGDPAVAFQRTGPGAPEDGVVTVFPFATLPDRAVPGNTPESQLDNQ